MILREWLVKYLYLQLCAWKKKQIENKDVRSNKVEEAVLMDGFLVC